MGVFAVVVFALIIYFISIYSTFKKKTCSIKLFDKEAKTGN